jgi:hypothetical protein
MFVAWGTVDLAGFTLVQGQLAITKSSHDVERGFCARCGTSLSYRHALRSTEIDFTLASLDDPAAVRPKCHIWVQDKIPWVDITDGLPAHRAASADT